MKNVQPERIMERDGMVEKFYKVALHTWLIVSSEFIDAYLLDRNTLENWYEMNYTLGWTDVVLD